MQLLNSAAGHLTYCTNIHAAEGWSDMLTSLKQCLPEIKAQLPPQQALGVGLRIAASAAHALQNPAAFADLKALLGQDFYIFTINGFPYGAFHGEKVKENAYLPDWSDTARLEYTNLLADLLVELLPSELDGSISTVPGTFKPWAASEPARIAQITTHLIAHTAHLHELQQRTGKTIMLVLEPEPYCLLATINETIDFFQQQLFSTEAAQQLSSLTGLDVGAAQDTLRRHLGVCYDVCHAAVEFEDPRASIDALRNAGIAIGKLQLSSALKISNVSSATWQQLKPFDEPVYLHQVVQNKSSQFSRFVDLNDALSQLDQAIGAEWRIHFHVPIFLAEMEEFSTTQDFLREILQIHREQPISQHLEVETYTWDVLPAQYRNVDVSTAIARELNWVLGQFAQ